MWQDTEKLDLLSVSLLIERNWEEWLRYRKLFLSVSLNTGKTETVYKTSLKFLKQSAGGKM